jgi:hypothetical protein
MVAHNLMVWNAMLTLAFDAAVLAKLSKVGGRARALTSTLTNMASMVRRLA